MLYYAICKCGRYSACRITHRSIKELAVAHAIECGSNVVLRKNDFNYTYITPEEAEEWLKNPLPPISTADWLRVLKMRRLRGGISG